MLGFSKKTRGELMRAELGESWDHFLQAASHAANGVGSSMGPRTAKMRGAASRGWGTTSAAFAPLAAAYREGAADAMKLSAKAKAKRAKKGSQMANKKMGMLIGLLAAGAAVGAAGALVMKRRKQKNWSEFDPNVAFEGGSGIGDDAKSIVGKATSKMDGAMDKAAHHTGKVMNKAADKLEQTASSLRNSDFKAKMDDAAEAANDATDKFTASKHNGRF